MMKTAIIIGATGLTGSILLNKLIADNRYETIKVFSRTKCGVTHTKVIEKLGNLIELENFKADFIADEVFCCIGTTARQTPDQTEYHKIDFGIPTSAAKLCRKNGIDTFLVISAIASNAKSKIFYNKTKGEMEQAVLDKNITNTYILRPSLIIGKRAVKRFGEFFGIIMSKFLNPFLRGKLKKYRSIEAEKIAQAMINLANNKPKIQLVESDEIEKFVD